MGLFKSPEEKAAKKEEKLNAMMPKYGLETLSLEYREAVKNINLELMGSGAMEAGMKLAYGTKNEDLLKMGI